MCDKSHSEEYIVQKSKKWVEYYLNKIMKTYFCNEKKEPSELAEILQMHLAHFVFRGFNGGGYC